MANTVEERCQLLERQFRSLVTTSIRADMLLEDEWHRNVIHHPSKFVNFRIESVFSQAEAEAIRKEMEPELLALARKAEVAAWKAASDEFRVFKDEIKSQLGGLQLLVVFSCEPRATALQTVGEKPPEPSAEPKQWEASSEADLRILRSLRIAPGDVPRERQ